MLFVLRTFWNMTCLMPYSKDKRECVTFGRSVRAIDTEIKLNLYVQTMRRCLIKCWKISVKFSCKKCMRNAKSLFCIEIRFERFRRINIFVSNKKNETKYWEIRFGIFLIEIFYSWPIEYDLYPNFVRKILIKYLFVLVPIKNNVESNYRYFFRDYTNRTQKIQHNSIIVLRHAILNTKMAFELTIFRNTRTELSAGTPTGPEIVFIFFPLITNTLF